MTYLRVFDRLDNIAGQEGSGQVHGDFQRGYN